MVDASGLKLPECPRTVLDLIERFGLHRESYKDPEYKEAQVRDEFLNPLFEELGWDIHNKKGYAEAYKDVVHEDAIKVGGSTKAPDYSFRVGGARKFFVEAKKPAEDLKQKGEHAYQLRRYAWTAKLPVSILTDFEEFAVFDCTKRPKPTDKASTSRVLYLTYDEYPARWGDVWCKFSKDAILKGEFDRFAESAKRKRGTAEVDDEFLKEIEQWREWLARNLALRNERLTIRELNYAVTKTIDRIIFLRMCEDRGIETQQGLSTLRNSPNIYPRLIEVFRRADERYNSGLFHFTPEKGRTETPDELTPGLNVDDKVLKDIISRLYYPQSPYEFSVMPTEILGQVYEQFLGKVITLTAGHRAKVEDKPEVKKAGGVYYTPKYIVDYIVEHTVGKLLEGKTPKDVGPMLEQRKPSRARKEAGLSDRAHTNQYRDSDGAANPSRARKEADHTSPLAKGGFKGGRTAILRILDPACGSGSFLLGGYQFLLDWHLNWYIEDDPEKWARKKVPPIYQSPKADPTAKGPTWRLTVAERKRILLNNIYGVDIDPQAVEVTKLSLLLKVLEGESQQTLDNQLRLFHERALPDLGNNIKCGNSLIGPDFYENRQLPLLDEEERYRINAFDWHAEFPEVFAGPNGQGGGFDAVIGNPPYGIVFAQDTKQFLERKYPAFQRNNDLYVCFIERSLLLLRPRGLFAFIVPNTFLRGPYFDGLKQRLISDAVVTRIVDFGPNQVFPGVHVFTALLFVQHGAPSGPTGDETCEFLAAPAIPDFLVLSSKSTLDSQTLRSLCWSPQAKIADALLRGPTLGDVAFVKDVGLNYWTKGRGKKRGGSIADRILYEGPRQHRKDRPYIKGRDISRYVVRPPQHWLRHDYSERLNEPVDVFRFTPEYLERPKVVYRQTADRIVAGLDPHGLLVDKTVHLIVPSAGNARNIRLEFFLGLVNSRLLDHIYRTLAQEDARAFAQVKTFRVKQLPIPSFDEGDRKIWARHDRMVKLVQGMLTLHKELDAAKTPTDKTAIQRQIDATDRQIDQLVYQLYGLTDDEIKIVEEATQR